MKKIYPLIIAYFCFLISGYSQSFSLNPFETDNFDLGLVPKPEKSTPLNKAPTNGILRLDSITTLDVIGNVPPFRKIFSYASQHLYDTITVYMYKNGIWGLRQQTIYTYDSTFNLIQSLDQQAWNATSNDWMIIYKYDYTYQNNLLTERIRQNQWDTTIGFKNIERYEYSYNQTGGLIETNLFQWDDNNQNWSFYDVRYDTLDAQNKLLSSTRYRNDGNATAIYRSEFQYDQNDMVEYIKRLSGTLNSSLGLSGEVFFTNQNGLFMEYESWGYLLNQGYVPISKYTNVYDSLSNRTEEHSFTWEVNPGNWKPNLSFQNFVDHSYEYTDLIAGYSNQWIKHKLDSISTTNHVGNREFLENYHWSPVPNCKSDLSPKTTIIPNNISGVAGVGITVQISEVNDLPTDGSPIEVRIPVDSRFTFSWDPTLTMVSLIPVDNADWSYMGDNGLVHTFKYTGPTGQIPASGKTTFGLLTTYDPQATSGITTINATVYPFSGGEENLINNSSSESLTYFD